MDEVKIDTTQDTKTIPEQTNIVETEQEINWKKFRESRERERKEAEAVAKRAAEKEAEAAALRAALEAVVNKQPQQKQNYNDTFDDNEETEEQKIDRRVAEALAKREAEYERLRKEQELVEYPKKLENTFKDFNQICSTENLDYLEYHHPELARSLGNRPQGFEKWADIYNAIKRYIPNADSRKDEKKAEKNLQKPGSISSPNIESGRMAQMSSQKELEEKRAENWKRMQKMLKGLN